VKRGIRIPETTEKYAMLPIPIRREAFQISVKVGKHVQRGVSQHIIQLSPKYTGKDIKN
jgi:hypothetical protein